MGDTTLDPNLYYRISDLPNAQAITGAEVVEAVQDGKNVKFTLEQLFVVGESAYDIAVEHGYDGDKEAWLASLIGADGKSAYELAVADGYEGTVAQWLQTLKGESALEILSKQFPQVTDAASLAVFLKGEKGDRGEVGVGTRIVGTVSVKEDLPDPVAAEAANHAYLLDKHIWIALQGVWTDMGDLSGPEGMGLRVMGTLPSTDALPTEHNEPGHTYIVNRNMYVWDGGQWSEVGQIGPEGSSAYQVALENGYEGSALQWLQSLKGEKGDSIKGDPGPKGDAADALRLKGKLISTEFLPVEPPPVVGDAYVIGNNVHAFTTTGWQDIGRFNGASAFEIAREKGYPGTVEAWLESLKGTDGEDGVNGKSAYELAVDEGYPGTLTEWLAEQKMSDVAFDGAADSVDALPAAPTDGSTMTYIVGTTIYIGKDGQWTSSGAVRGLDGKDGDDGVNGKSALEILTEAYPEVVDAETMAEFLKGEPGESIKGDKGDEGPAGPGLHLRGTFAEEAELASVAEPLKGDLAVVGRYFYIHDGVQWNRTIEVVGRDGEDGEDGTNGTNGTGIVVKGELASSDLLPEDAPASDAYVINGEIWLKTPTDWINAGRLRGTDGTDGNDGEDGQSAYSLAVELGFNGSPEEWIDSLNGTNGLSAFDLAREQNPELLDVSEWLASLVGPEGPMGPMGPGVKILGRLGSTAELPATAAARGDGYIIGLNFWGWDGGSFIDCGPIQGPQGERGIQGIQGPKGNPGQRGERGASIILLDHNPGAIDGAVTDVCINTTTQGVFLKSSSTIWTFIGFFGGGNVYSPDNDGKQYVRKGNAWVQFNQYDLNAVATTGACDLTQANVFKIDNAANTAKNVSFLGAPAGRVTTVVLLITGNAGAVNWPAGIQWSDGLVPELGTVLTNVVLLWDGVRFIGQVGAKV